MHVCEDMYVSPCTRNPRLDASLKVEKSCLCILFIELRSYVLDTFAHSPGNTDGNILSDPRAAHIGGVRHAASCFFWNRLCIAARSGVPDVATQPLAQVFAP